MFEIKFVKKSKKSAFMFNKLFSKICPFWDHVEEYGGARQATDDNIIWRMRVSCWITKATHRRARACTHTDTLRICNTYCFSTATIATRTRLNITFYVHCLPCYINYTMCPRSSVPSLKIFLYDILTNICVFCKFFLNSESCGLCLQNVCWSHCNLCCKDNWRNPTCWENNFDSCWLELNYRPNMVKDTLVSHVELV